MKRLLFTFAMLASVFAAMADYYFTAGENDTVKIAAADRGHNVILPVRSHFDARLDTWRVNLYPAEGTQYVKSEPGEGMNLYYTNIYGETVCYSAQLAYGTPQPDDHIAISSASVSVYGYWDYNHDGVLESYGTVKWEAGDHDPMFLVELAIGEDFTAGEMTLSGTLTSSFDSRGGVLNTGVERFNRTVAFIVTFERGDVNGDGEVNIGDVTALINCLLTDTQPDTDGQFNAADVDGSGFLSITDVTELINILLTQ